MNISEKLTTIAENTLKVYEAGKKAEYDKFWDVFQQNGSRTNYERAFAHGSFDFRNFYPKYDINIINGSMSFYNWKNYNETFAKGSLKQRLDECGVKLNTSQATNLSNCFAYGLFTELPTINLTGLTSASINIFAYNYGCLKTIGKIIVDENTPFSSSMFTQDTGLENLTIEGTIGQNGFNLQWSTKLSGASIVSIIEALSTTTSGLTVTLSQTAVNNMVFPITSIRTDADGNEYTTTYNSWVDLAGDKEDEEKVGIRPNWNISLL